MAEFKALLVQVMMELREMRKYSEQCRNEVQELR